MANSSKAISDSLTPFKPWKLYQKILFRIAFIFFIIMSIPTGDWYEKTFSVDWTNLHYRDLYVMARFLPNYIGGYFNYGVGGYFSMLAVLGVAIPAALIWGIFDRKRADYNVLYYWLRVVVRYRTAIYLFVWGLIKIFPVQCPYPSLGILNTDLGDLTMQKVYWWSVGIAPWYEVFAGSVEFTAGVLVFFRRTTAFGAALLLGALGCLTVANIQYDGHVHVESTYFALTGFFLLTYYLPDIYRLMILKIRTVPHYYAPTFKQPWLKYTRLGIRVAIVAVFVVVLGYLSYINFRYDPYNQAISIAPKPIRGYYAVKEFRINNKILPYVPNDTLRWEDVTFENWTSMTFKVNQPMKIELPKGYGNIGFTFNSGAPMRDIDRNLEAFTGGTRRAFHYYLDTVNKVLYLQDKLIGVKYPNAAKVDSARKRSKLYAANWISAAAKANISDEYSTINKKSRSTRRTRAYLLKNKADDKRNRMVLHYEIPDAEHVVLNGINETGDSIHVVLERSQRSYTLQQPQLHAGVY